MKSFKILSFIAFLMIIALFVFKLTDDKNDPKTLSYFEKQQIRDTLHTKKIVRNVNKAKSSLSNVKFELKKFENEKTPTHKSGNSSTNVVQIPMEFLKKLSDTVNSAEKKISFLDKYMHENEQIISKDNANSKNDTDKENTMLIFQFIISMVFCIPAIYIIISNRYGDEKIKWAFSILSLVAGFWLGNGISL